MFLLAVFLPFFGFCFISFFGRYFGSLGSFLLGFFNLCLCLVFSLFCFLEVCVFNTIVYCELGYWFDTFFGKVCLDFFFDSLNVLMLVIVYCISFCVFIYSFVYLSNDPHQVRFFSLLELFTFFMVLLVCSCNLIQLFFSWEGVGLVSFLLIGFWYSRLAAIKAAFKAIFVNKIGDVFLFLGIVLCWFLCGSLNYFVIFLLSECMSDQCSFLFCLLLVCFFVGICAKSAQLGLHIWLPDAMEGPTPVSALLHAATMVAVGVFFFLRFSLLFSMVYEILLLFLFIGGLTCIFSGIIGLFQYDIKKVVAYSTCSQLGLMFVGCSMLLVSGAFFHLFVHAFCKALLFLGCGVIIHFFMEEQDLRFMGSSVRFVGPIYISFLFGILALVGFPFLSGFYSKDFFIESSFFFFFFDGFFVGFLLCLSSILTLFYSLKLLLYCFFGFPNSHWKSYFDIHFNFDLMLFICVLLGVLSCIVGFLFVDIFLGFGSLVFFLSLVSVNFYEFIYDEFLISWFWKNLVLFFLLFGFIFGMFFVEVLRKFYFFYINEIVFMFYYFLVKKGCFDDLYNYILDSLGNLIYFFVHDFDKGLLESVSSFGVSFFFMGISKWYSYFQSGNLFHYLYFFVVGFFFSLFIFFGFII